MSNAKWKDNSIQFPRLIAELDAMGVFTPEVLDALKASMDLSYEEIAELRDRAEEAWEVIQERGSL